MFTVCSIIISLNTFAQTYSSPESLEFDYANDRWLISNKSANNILARSSSTGLLSIFAGGISSPHGIEIANDTVYVCSGGSLVAYELNTGQNVFTINLGATYLNGITHDSTYLYITDFSAKVIYRFNMVDRTFTQFVTGLSKTPNGIIYDGINNRCVFVTWGSNAPVMAFDVTSGSVSTIIPTSLGNCDGIAIDGSGNFYISSWTLNGISKFDNVFSAPPVTVVTGLTSPADIFYNIQDDTLGVANSGSLSNTTYHFFGSTTSVNEVTGNDLEITISPNPIINNAELKFKVKVSGHASIKLFDVQGKLVRVLLDEPCASGYHYLNIERSNLPSGNYLLKFDSKEMNAAKKLLVID